MMRIIVDLQIITWYAWKIVRMGCDSTIFAHIYIVCRRATQMIDGRLPRAIIHSHSWWHYNWLLFFLL